MVCADLGGGPFKAIEITAGSTFRRGNPRALVPTPAPRQGPLLSLGRMYDVTADGEQFIMVTEDAFAATALSSQIHVIQNWFEELKERVPVPE